MMMSVKRRTLALAATIIGSAVVFLDATIVNLALPDISRSMHASFSQLQWVMDGYLLSLSALLLLGGSLGDIFGRKKVYLAGIVGFAATSLMCALAPTTIWLISFRAVQGLFGALVVPGALAIINTNFPRDQRGAAIGTWSAWSGIMAAIGPLVGGYIIDATSWRWIFFINIPLIIVCIILAIKGVEESIDKRVRRVDTIGASLCAIALAGITYGLIEGPVSHWSRESRVALIIGALFTVTFIWDQHRKRDPLVPLGLFKSRNFSGSNIMTFAMYGALAGFMFALVIYMQTKLGYSALKAGASLLPVSIMLLLFSRKVGALSTKYGPRRFMTTGPLIASAGILLLVNYDSSNSYLWFLLPRVILFSVGLVLLVAPLTTTVMTSVDETSSGIASGINNAVSRIAGLVVIALLGLAGAGSIFRFSMILCGALAAAAGIISYLTIQNPKSAGRA